MGRTSMAYLRLAAVLVLVAVAVVHLPGVWASGPGTDLKEAFTGEPLHVGAFNIEVLGTSKMKDEAVVRRLVKVSDRQNH